MKERVLALIKPQWRTEFAKFVEEGEASQALLDYLDSDDNAQRAAESVFNEQAEELRPFALQLLAAIHWRG